MNELVVSAVRQAGDYISSLIDHAVDQFVAFWKQSLADSGFRAGCPVVALAVDHRDDLPEAADVVREIFACWRAKIRDLLVASGFPADRARRLAALAVATSEGAVILCRAEGSASPLDDVAAELIPLFR